MSGGAEGHISVAVWPTQIGVGTAPDERLPVDRRSQITWEPRDGKIVGSARVWMPKGQYQYLLYFHDLTSLPVAFGYFPQPFVIDNDDWVTVNNIENNDPILNSLSGVAR